MDGWYALCFVFNLPTYEMDSTSCFFPFFISEDQDDYNC